VVEGLRRSVGKHFNVIVLGGGPAGTAIAISLAARGCTVAVLERSQYDRMRVGETLPPSILPSLNALGLCERFQREDNVASSGVVCVWGDEEPYDNDYIWSPYGNGWQIDRRWFDKMLAEAADAAGARVYRAVRIKSCSSDGARKWHMNLVVDHVAMQLSADYLVVATGRSSPSVGGTNDRFTYDRLIAVVAFIEVSGLVSDTRTLVEASENGWWYSAYLARNALVISYLTDYELLSQDRAGCTEGWLNLLRKAPYTSRRLAACDWQGPLRVVAANTYRRQRIVGVNYLFVGDAAAAIDPLSGHGISNALEASGVAAPAIVGHLDGDRSGLENYVTWVETRFVGDLKARAKYYALEKRWPRSQFWQRRQIAFDCLHQN
jgi:flavin-dependent dehydrogenase